MSDSQGRHRAAPTRASRVRRLVTATLLVGSASVAVATWPTAASAEAPTQTAWWNFASAGGQSAPDPATPAGGLHISVASGQVTAFGAVLYSLPEGDTATIELSVANLTATPVVNATSPTTAPQADVMACPTKDTSWNAGDAQDWSTRPEYDCTRGFLGSLSADNKTLTFLADSSIETVPGQLSVAIVPVMTNAIPGVGTPAPTDMTQPFSMDIDKPVDTSLTITSSAPTPVTPTGTGTGTTTPTTPDTTSSTTGDTGTASTGGGEPLPPALTGDAGSTGTTADSGTAPVVAPTTTQVPPAAPVAAKSSTSDRAHNAALAMLLLIGIGMIAMSSGQMQRAPRLIGGAGRHTAGAVTGAGAAAGAAAAAPMMPMSMYGNRGLGRFAKPRTEPARPLT